MNVAFKSDPKKQSYDAINKRQTAVTLFFVNIDVDNVPEYTWQAAVNNAKRRLNALAQSLFFKSLSANCVLSKESFTFAFFLKFEKMVHPTVDPAHPNYMAYMATQPDSFRHMLKTDIPTHKDIRLMIGFCAAGLGLAVAAMYWSLRKPEVGLNRGGERGKSHPLEWDRAQKVYGKKHVLKYGAGEASAYMKPDKHLEEVQRSMSEARRQQ